MHFYDNYNDAFITLKVRRPCTVQISLIVQKVVQPADVKMNIQEVINTETFYGEKYESLEKTAQQIFTNI